MLIKPNDGATQTRLSSVRPSALPALASEAQASLVNLSISTEVRALSTLLSQALPALGTLHLLDVLTPQDQLMLTRAVQFAASEGIPLDEVRKLVVDLALYRLEARQPQNSGLLGETPHTAEPVDVPASAPAMSEPSVASHANALLGRVPVAPPALGQLAPAPSRPAWLAAARPAALGAAPASASMTAHVAGSASREGLATPLNAALQSPLRAAAPAERDASAPLSAARGLADVSGSTQVPKVAETNGAILDAVQLAARLAAAEVAGGSAVAPVHDNRMPVTLPGAAPAPTRESGPALMSFTPLARAAAGPFDATAPALPMATLFDGEGPMQTLSAASPLGATAVLAGHVDADTTAAPLPHTQRATGTEQLSPRAPAQASLEAAPPLPWSASPTATPIATTKAPVTLRMLPLFTPRDEQLAHAILSSLALHETLVDSTFVRTLLDPDRRPSHAVDFGFLRRLVIALSSHQLGDAVDPRVSGERRDARTALAQAVVSLSATLGELPPLSDLDLAQGAVLLRQRALDQTPTEGASAAGSDAAGAQAADAAPRSDASATPSPPQPARPGAPSLGRADRALLRVLYAAASHPSELERVDQVAHALRALRSAERREPVPASARAVRPSVPPTQSPPARSVAPPRLEPKNELARGARASSAPSMDDALEPGPTPTRERELPLAATRPERVGSEPFAVATDVTRSAPHVEATPHREPLPLPHHALGPAADVPVRGPEQARSETQPSAQPSLDARHELDTGARAPQDTARSYGSSSQLTARVVGSYARIASESAFPPAMGARTALLGSARQGLEALRDPPPMPTLTRPLNSAELLGASGLVRELKARAARTARLRKRHLGAGHVRPLETLREAAYDAEADDPVVDSAPRRRRARWHLLLERRKRRRTKER